MPLRDEVLRAKQGKTRSSSLPALATGTTAITISGRAQFEEKKYNISWVTN